MTTQQGMILDNFTDFLREATREELTHIIHLMFKRVEVDFALKMIMKIEVHPEFIELFKMGLKEGEWKVQEPGVIKLVK
jgi:hypothetical protein